MNHECRDAYYQDAVSSATKNGDAVELKRLLAIYPHGHDLALVQAARAGSTVCLKMLLPLCGPPKNDAMMWAALLGHHDCMDVLFEVSNNTEVLHHLKTSYAEKRDKWVYLEKKMKSLEEKTYLQQHIDVNAISKQRIM